MMSRRWIAGLAFLGLMASLAGTARADTQLHLLGDRFRVSATWRTADGSSGAGQAVPRTSETGLFWFFSETNAELVVKMLNACTPPYNRFWFYAAGLTDVEVTLTVEDAWTGQTKTYTRPRGTLFAPIADTSTFDGCGVVPPCGQGTAAEIAATPRPNPEAEALALLLGPGITADPAIYARLDADLAQIRTLAPELSGIEFQYFWGPSALLIQLSPSAHQAALAGQLTELDCLNSWYHGTITRVWQIIPWAVVSFEGLFHPHRIGPDYLSLPSVEAFESDDTFYFPGVPQGRLCAAIDGTAYDYFLVEPNGLTWYFRVPQAGATPIAMGHPGAQADWWARFEKCEVDLQKAAYH